MIEIQALIHTDASTTKTTICSANYTHVIYTSTYMTLCMSTVARKIRNLRWTNKSCTLVVSSSLMACSLHSSETDDCLVFLIHPFHLMSLILRIQKCHYLNYYVMAACYDHPQKSPLAAGVLGQVWCSRVVRRRRAWCRVLKALQLDVPPALKQDRHLPRCRVLPPHGFCSLLN